MIIDGLLLFTGSIMSPAGSPPAQSTGPYTDDPTNGTVSSNVLDLHLIRGVPVLGANQGARDIGIGDDPAMKVMVYITAAVAAGLILNLQGAPDNGSGLPGAFTTYATTGAMGALAVGTMPLAIDMPRPPVGSPMPRFLRLSWSGATGGGGIEAALVLDRFDQPFHSTTIETPLSGYPAGVTVAN